MAERAPYFDTPDKCDGCPLVELLAEESRKKPLKMTYAGADRMEQLFDDCPGYRRGALGVLRSLRMTFREGLMYGGPIIDMDTHTKQSRLTLPQPQGCGTMVREMVKTIEPVPLFRNQK